VVSVEEVGTVWGKGEERKVRHRKEERKEEKRRKKLEEKRQLEQQRAMKVEIWTK
jgi:hypothetical protein